MKKPVKPTKTRLVQNSRTFYSNWQADPPGSVELWVFLLWLKEILPAKATNTKMWIEEEFSEIDQMFLRADIAVSWMEPIKNTRYKSEMNRYEKQMKKYKKAQ